MKSIKKFVAVEFKKLIVTGLFIALLLCVLLGIVLLGSDNAHAVPITYPMFKQCYMTPRALRHPDMQAFIQAMRGLLLAGKGVVFQYDKSFNTPSASALVGFYLSAPPKDCTIDYPSARANCTIEGMRTTFWNLPSSIKPAYLLEFKDECAQLGLTSEQFDGLVSAIEQAMTDANGDYVQIPGFGRLRTAETFINVGYSGVSYTNQDFMQSVDDNTPYSGGCAMVGGGKPPETVVKDKILLGGLKIIELKSDSSTVGRLATVYFRKIDNNWAMIRFSSVNDNFGKPELVSFDGTKVRIYSNNAVDFLGVSIVGGDVSLLPTQETTKPFIVGAIFEE